MDHIRVSQCGNEKIKAIMVRNTDEIKSEVLAEELSFDNAKGYTKGYTKEWNLNGEEVTLGVERV
jgi:isoleucyl-tRNA synthetase